MDASKSSLYDFLINLSKDPAARSEYALDPSGFMKTSGLAQHQIDAVLSQDPARIQAEIGSSVEKPHINITVTVNIHLV
jgi:hypothetical protein